MHSTLALVVLFISAQVTDGSRYGGYQPEDTESNSGAESSDFFSPVTPPQPPAGSQVDAVRTNSEVGNPSSTGSLGSSEVRQPPLEHRATARPPAAPSTAKPKDMLAALSRPPVNGQLAGELVTLTDAVRNAISRDQQTEIISAYWDLSTAVTDYYLSSRESTELETLRQGVGQPGAAWEEARRGQVSRIQLARRTAELAQYRLRELMRNPALQGLPLPIDVPHTGAYETRYQENFAGRESNLSRDLHELVPSIYRALSLQAEQMASDEGWLNTVSTQRSPQTDGTLLLKTYELVSLRRREFVRTVQEYNKQIANYTQLASPGRVGTDRLVAMLIEDPSPSTLLREDADVRTTGAEEPVDDSNSSDSSSIRPRTFREGTSSSASDETPEQRPVTPGTPNGEHSIMVKPI